MNGHRDNSRGIAQCQPLDIDARLKVALEGTVLSRYITQYQGDHCLVYSTGTGLISRHPLKNHIGDH